MRLASEAGLDEVIAAQRDDVDAVAGKRGQLVLQRVPEPSERALQLWRQIRRVWPPGGDDDQRGRFERADTASERLAGSDVNALEDVLTELAAQPRQRWCSRDERKRPPAPVVVDRVEEDDACDIVRVLVRKQARE